jgi:hypothetical protein
VTKRPLDRTLATFMDEASKWVSSGCRSIKRTRY